jgi:hypothetical protein
LSFRHSISNINSNRRQSGKIWEEEDQAGYGQRLTMEASLEVPRVATVITVLELLAIMANFQVQVFSFIYKSVMTW